MIKSVLILKKTKLISILSHYDKDHTSVCVLQGKKRKLEVIELYIDDPAKKRRNMTMCGITSWLI